MRARWIRLVVALAAICAAACGGNVKATKARNSAYRGEFEDVWARVVAAVAVDYPVVRVLDKDRRRIVTCWRPIERRDEARIEGAPGSGWFLFRAIVEISRDPPYRVSVSGRAAEYRPPQIIPSGHGDITEPGWVEGRTDRVYAQIYENLAPLAVEAKESTPPASDPGEPENVGETCVIRASEFAIMWQGMEGIVLGDPGAAPEGPGQGSP